MRTFPYLLLFSVFLIGCQVKKEPTDLSSLLPDGPPPIPLEGGVWKSSCLNDGSGFYQRQTYAFAGGNLTETVQLNSNSACSSSLFKLELVGSYQITKTDGYSSPIPSVGSYSKAEYEITLQDITATPTNGTTVTGWNAGSYCGKNNWVLNQAQSILGAICGGSAMPIAGTMDYDIMLYQVTNDPFLGYTAGDLKTGYKDSSHDGTSAAKRPTAFNGSVIFRK